MHEENVHIQPDPVQRTTLNFGTIKSVTPDSITVKFGQGDLAPRDETFVVTPSMKVMINSIESSVAELKAGDMVHIMFDSSAPTLVKAIIVKRA